MHTFHMKKLTFLFFFIPIVSVAQGYEKTNNIEVFSNSEEEIFVEGIYDLSKKVNELPAAISILPYSRYITISPTHLSEALNGISGVNIHRGSGQEHLTSIRSPVLTGGSGAGSFLYMEDGVPLRAAGFSNVNGLFEASPEFSNQIEVLKGPGPVQYGSNAVHGLINFQNNSINNDKLTFLLSEDGYKSLIATTSALPVDVSVSISHDNGFREESGFDQQKLQLKYFNRFNGWNINWLSSFNNLNQETAGFIKGDDAYLEDDIRFTNPNPEAFRDGVSYRSQFRIERNYNNGTSLAFTPYARYVDLRFLRHFVPGQALEKNRHTSVGLQSAFYSKNFNIGADFEYTKGSLYEYQENESRFSYVRGLHYDYSATSLVGALYAHKTSKLSEHITIDLGARAEFTTYNYDNNATVGRSGRFIRVADRIDNFLTITPKASLSYSFDNKNMIYVRAARGSRAPQVSDLYSVQQNQVAGEAEIETLDSLELGFKGKIGSFDTELSAFSMWKDNFFFRNSNGFNVVNGKTRHQGMELSFIGYLTDWMSISGDGTLAKHTYSFNENVGSAANNIISGSRVDSAPDTLSHMRFTFLPTANAEVELEWRHVGSYFTNPGNTNKYQGHDIFITRVNYALEENINLFGRVDNILNKKYADRADYAFGSERYFPGRPRTLFFGLSTSF